MSRGLDEGGLFTAAEVEAMLVARIDQRLVEERYFTLRRVAEKWDEHFGGRLISHVYVGILDEYRQWLASEIVAIERRHPWVSVARATQEAARRQSSVGRVLHGERRAERLIASRNESCAKGMNHDVSVWKCDACGGTFATAHPVECPHCQFFHCGDVDCCNGEPFILVEKPNEPTSRERGGGL